jgi:hypothetical protein
MSARAYNLRVDVSVTEVNDYRNSLRISEEAVVDAVSFDQVATLLKRFDDVVAAVKAEFGQEETDGAEAKA